MSFLSVSYINSKISLCQGDITKLDVDATVNSVIKTLTGGESIGEAIRKAARAGLLDECQKLNGCKTGEWSGMPRCVQSLTWAQRLFESCSLTTHVSLSHHTFLVHTLSLKILLSNQIVGFKFKSLKFFVSLNIERCLVGASKKKSRVKELIILNEIKTPQDFLSFTKPENLRQMIPDTRTRCS